MGGAIFNHAGNCYVVNCSFVNNTAKEDGDAIFDDYGNYAVNCSFVNNTAKCGGAIYSEGFNCSVLNCSFVNNIAEYGSAIYHTYYSMYIPISGDYDYYYGNLSISNSLFENNKNANYGIYLNQTTASFNNNTLIDDIIYNNGTIESPTTIVVLGNKTINSTKNKITINATIYDDNGNIIVCDDFNFTINNRTIKATLENDTFKANAVLEEGINVIGAVAVNGTLSNYTVKTGIVNVGEVSIIINAPDITKYYKGTERFKVQVTDKNGNALNNTAVTITINGVSYDRKTNEFGNTPLGLGLDSGVYDVIINCSDYSVGSTVTIKPTVVANDFTKIFKNGTQYLATFTDSLGNLLKEGNAIFNINGVNYTRKINDSGISKLNINLLPGEYIITATNPVTEENHGSIITVLSCIDENYNITKYYKNATQYSVRVLDANGNPVGKGAVVQFNINGVLYNRTTNASGYAKLNINLPAGEYIISATYNGLTVSNAIIVLSTLIGNNMIMNYLDGSKFEVKLVDKEGNIISGQSVNFNINGMFYDRTTDANGYARLNINLPEGEYIITSTYEDAVTSNTIKIYSQNYHGKK